MQTEIEAKFLNVNIADMRQRLQSAGAVLVHKDRLMRRQTFDFPDRRLEKIGGWVRVRDEGDVVTLSYKQLQDRTLHGTKEATVVVNSMELAVQFLTALGLVQKAEQETRREKWTLGDCEITIDTWPWIPGFVEVEGPSEEAVRTAAAALGFNWGEAMHGSVETAYQRYFDVTETEVNEWKEIKFIPVPSWWEERRKKK